MPHASRILVWHFSRYPACFADRKCFYCRRRPESGVRRSRPATALTCRRIDIAMTHPVTFAVRPLAHSDERQWRELFRGYRDFYLLEKDESVVSTTWAWLTNPAHECNALVAEADGHILGIAHYRAFPRPSTGTVGIWLDDLFTDPDARGRGVARALIERLTRIAGAEGRSVVRWITAKDNDQAQALYDQIAVRTNWVTYDAAPAAEQAWDGEQPHGAQ